MYPGFVNCQCYKFFKELKKVKDCQSSLPVVDVDDGEHEPLPRLELILDAVLKSFPLNLQGVDGMD